jgi:adenosylhomocysteinase
VPSGRAGEVACDITDSGLAEQGRLRLAWTAANMPVLRGIGARFARERPFDGLRVAACLHVTPETGTFLRVLAAGGAQIRLAASNPLATSDDVAAALVALDGIRVFARHGVDRTGYDRHIAQALDAGPQLVFDDGCDLVNGLHARPELLAGVLGGCEETATGVLRLRQLSRDGRMRFPMVAVNDTDTRRMIDNRLGTGQSTIDALMRATNLLLAGRTVVVAGYGPCGRGIAARARGMGAAVVVTEIDATRALEASLEGYRVLPMAAAAAIGEVFLTATGGRGAVRAEHFAAMKDGAVLGNAGHFDVEIDVPALRALAAQPPQRVRPQTDEYRLADGRRLLLIAEGRLVNLGAAEGHPAAVMDLGFAVQALSAEWLISVATTLSPDVYGVPAGLDAEVARLALAALGVEIDTPTPDQRAYATTWQLVPGGPAGVCQAQLAPP